MPTWDAPRLRLLVSEAELDGASAAATARTGLPDPSTEMLETVDRPSLRVLVQVFTSAAQPATYRIWATRTAAVVGTAADGGRTELSLSDPVLVPYIVAHLVGMRRLPPPLGRRTISVTAPDYQAAQAGSAQVPELAAVLRSRRSAWRVSARTSEESTRPTVRWMHVIDAGPAGLWRMTAERPEAADGVITLTPIRARQAWSTLIKEVLPSAARK